MKIDINQIPSEGLTLEEDVLPKTWDLDTDIVKFIGPIKIKAAISRITNAVTVYLELSALTQINCIRCLNEFKTNLKKALKLSYASDKANPIISLDLEIREEMILDYPIKPLCKPDCKGLCPKCGVNLNSERCKCGIV